MGVLSGYTVLEMGGIGPSPMAGMMMADMGAKVIRIERPGTPPVLGAKDASMRGKSSLSLNVKSKAGKAVFLRLLKSANVLTEGYRPGVMEALGLGPDVCLSANPKLVYGRMTGWGQDGPLAQTAGHDLNYIAATGALAAIGPEDRKPPVPLNLIGDMGGGAMLLITGVLGALLEAQNSGQGQVVDAAMVDGTLQLMWMQHSLQAGGLWDGRRRGANLLDGGAPFYDTYETEDGLYMALGAIEPQFYAQFLALFGLETADLPAQMDVSAWASLKPKFAAQFKTKTRQAWTEIFAGTDACVSPVLDMNEAPHFHHNQDREAFINLDGFLQPAPAPRFSRTPSSAKHSAPALGADTQTILQEAGYRNEEIKRLRSSGAI